MAAKRDGNDTSHRKILIAANGKKYSSRFLDALLSYIDDRVDQAILRHEAGQPLVGLDSVKEVRKP